MRPTRSGPRQGAAKTAWLHVSALLLLTLAAYANVYQNDYQLDDTYRVRDNPHVRNVFPVSRFFVDPDTTSTLPRIVQYRPLLPLSFAVNHAVTGMSLAGFHGGNLLLHTAVVVMVYLLLLELLTHWARIDGQHPPPGSVALLAAATFAIHPIAGIPVNYISARDLQLMALFFLAFLLVWIRMQRRGDSLRGWLAALTMLLLSLLAKQNGVVAPAVMVAFCITCGGQSLRAARTWLPALGVAGFIGTYLAAVRFGVGFSDLANVTGKDGTAFEYLATQLKVHIVEYLPLVFWPVRVRQAPYVEPSAGWLDAGTLAGALVILATLTWAWRHRCAQPVVAFAVFCWWILLALTSSVIPMIAVSVHYRPYLSLVFVSLLIAIALWRWLPPRWFRPVSISLLALLAMTSWRHNATWANGVSLFTHSVRYGGAPLAKLNLGVAFMGTDNERAAALFEEVLAGNPGYILARLNLGLTRARLGDVDAGLALIEEAVRQDPLRAQTHYWHAVALNEAGRSAEAARASASAVLLRPMELRYRYRAALDQQALEHYEKSLEHLRVVAEVDPEYRRVGFNIGFALQKLGRYDEAIETYRDFLRGNDDARAWSNLGWAYFDSGRCREAIDAFERTLRLLPGDPTAVSRIAECRRRLG